MHYRFQEPPTANTFEQGMLLVGKTGGRQIGVRTERHAVVVAGARSGKGVAIGIPNAYHWPHNLLCIDPKGEIVEAVWSEREATHGSPCYVLDPFRVANVPEDLRASYNPLEHLNPHSASAREDIRVIADGLVLRHDPRHGQWDDGAVDVLAGVIAHVVSTFPPAERSLNTVRKLLLLPPETREEFFREMVENPACGGLAENAGAIGLSTDKMSRDFVAKAPQHISWVASMDSVLSHSTFDLADLKTGKASVFLVLPARYLKEHSRFLRLFVRCALNVMMADLRGNRCLFMLDEFYALGRIDEIAISAGLMGGYGLHLMPFLQDLGQLRSLYGNEVAETFMGNADAQIFFGLSDTLTPRYVSDKIGVLTPEEIAPPLQLAPTPRRTIAQRRILGEYKDKYGPWWNRKTHVRREFEPDATAKERHAVAEANAEKAHAEAEARQRAEYEYRMRLVGSARVPADVLTKLTGKSDADGDRVAKSMVVFGPAGQVWNLKLDSYLAWDYGPARGWNVTVDRAPRLYKPTPPVLPAAEVQPADEINYGSGVLTDEMAESLPLLPSPDLAEVVPGGICCSNPDGTEKHEKAEKSGDQILEDMRADMLRELREFAVEVEAKKMKKTATENHG
ncbi:type IV secretory system conjugative DNA transfer family protein [Pseudohoeflea coraliihabitans]|uniref:Type IV secretory system conjugative DNA transfer family protein n=1 Tax=Pseudohoeflea coraliihabitans TaxID=2860393 RepID=A0ABS6WUZ8_9HYPH|nr:type IV secretory system conjugative DNA transfer family protein [Pseudohoeflea sp. DP4N28-3]MBW3099267.1 type IV secretory system conjugative DNA transfer family protein [Pseudohoeflea sp. DP4N28-3]